MAESLRGLTSETLRKSGYFEDESGIFFPISSVYGKKIGGIWNYPDRVPKYKHQIFPEEKTFGPYFYNEHILPRLFYGQALVVVEGHYDCLSLYQEGIPTISPMTSRLTYRDLEKIHRYTDKIILWFDSDKAGEDGANKTIMAAKSFDGMKVINFISNIEKDANDLLVNDKEEFLKAIGRLNFIRERLNAAIGDGR